MSVGVATGFTAEAFEAFLASRNEPEWLVNRRRAAWQLFEELPMPSRGEEEWMRTDIRLFRLDRFGFPADGAPTAASSQALLREGVELGGATAANDSRIIASHLDAKLAQRGVVFGSLDDLVLKHSDLVHRHLFRVVDPAYDRFAALHAAAASGGTLLYVPKGVKVEQPLHTLTTISEGGVDFSHLLIVLDEGAEATVLSETAGGAAQVFTRARSS